MIIQRILCFINLLTSIHLFTAAASRLRHMSGYFSKRRTSSNENDIQFPVKGQHTQNYTPSRNFSYCEPPTACKITTPPADLKIYRPMLVKLMILALKSRLRDLLLQYAVVPHFSVTV